MNRSEITIAANDIHAIAGPRQNVMAHFKQYGVALWLRAAGQATLFYTDGEGKMRQHTWQRFFFSYYNVPNVEPPTPVYALLP